MGMLPGGQISGEVVSPDSIPSKILETNKMEITKDVVCPLCDAPFPLTYDEDIEDLETECDHCGVDLAIEIDPTTKEVTLVEIMEDEDEEEETEDMLEDEEAEDEDDME
jgi:transcription elongation factor Elf1